MNVQFIKFKDTATTPTYQTDGSAAADIAACLEKPVELAPGARAIIPTGIMASVPRGYEIQVRARSGLSAKHGICLANGVGTIDSDYRGEIGVILINLGEEPFIVTDGMRIAQLVVAKYEAAEWTQVEKLDETSRGSGGYGSTGH